MNRNMRNLRRNGTYRWQTSRGFCLHLLSRHCFSFVDKACSDQDLDRAIMCYEKLGKYIQAGKTSQRITNDFDENANYENQ